MTDATAVRDLRDLLELPLSRDLARLRDTALAKHGDDGVYTVPTMKAIDARRWLLHDQHEHWLLWRSGRTASRLKEMPLEVLPEDLLAGRPLLREPGEEEHAGIEKLSEAYESIPPFPGGDAGHFQPDFEKLFAVGIGGLLDEVRTRRAAAADAESTAFYDACEEVLLAFSEYCSRVADVCEESASHASREQADRLTDTAVICRKISRQPPSTFTEAIQLMYLTIIALWYGEDHHLTCPGRIDRNLWNFYSNDIEAGRLTDETALDLICCLYIQLNLILHPGSAVAVMVGGRDENGVDVTNDLTYLCLIARYRTRLVYPTVGLAWHPDTSSDITDFACNLIARGTGDPAFFNDDLIAAGLEDHGVSKADSRNYMNSTCVEIKPVGASNIWVTQPYFNCPQALLNVLRDTVAGGQYGSVSYDDLCQKIRRDLTDTVREAATGLDRVWQERAVTGGFPLASCLINDCLANGTDFDRGGARYNWVENSFVGLANLVDSLQAIKTLVYEQKKLSLDEYWAAIENDFAGKDELLSLIETAVPVYGNGDGEADAAAREWAEFLIEVTESLAVGPHRYVPGFFCWIIHERFGSQTGATPDGRKAGFPLADGAGAAQGRERNGPTASILSTTVWNHRPAIGGLVHNVKLSESIVRDPKGAAALRALIETYMNRGGFEIQVNVVDSRKLRDAQIHPELYPDLLVRVAGYSDYFVHLNPNMQEEVIRRTEHVL